MNRFQRNYSHVIYVNRLYRNGFSFFEFRSRNRVMPPKSWLSGADRQILYTKILKKIEKFKIVLNCRETDARVSSAKIRGLQSLKLENDGMGTGLKDLHID